MIKLIDARVRRYFSGFRLAFRGVVTLVNAAGKVQLVQLNGISGEQLQDAELFQQFGFTSNPPDGAMAVVLPLGGKTAHSIVIATEHGAYRLTGLASGETAIYNKWGDHVTLGADRHIRVVSSAAVDITSPEVNLSGNLNVQGNAVIQGDVSDHGNKTMAGMRTVFNTHTQAVSGATAQAPTGQM